MTIILSAQYPGKADAPSAGYPQGSFKNVTAPGAGDGTPWEKVWINDYAGFFQKIIDEGGITPSAIPDTILASDHWDALTARFQQGITCIDAGTASVHAVSSLLGADPSALYNGLTVQYAVNILNTGAVDINYATIGAKDLKNFDGSELVGGELNAGMYITARYLSSPNEFRIVHGLPTISSSKKTGLILSNNGADANNDIDIATGFVSDSGGNAVLKLTTGLTKQLDAAWAAGTNAGGLFSGSKASDTWYHVFIIQKDTDGTIDIGFDTSVTAANIPSGYTKYKRIGGIKTDGSSNIEGFFEYPNGNFRWKNPPLDVNGVSSGTTVNDVTISTPLGVVTKARFNLQLPGDSDVYIKTPDVDDEAPSVTAAPLSSMSWFSGKGGQLKEELTDTSSQISYRTSISRSAYLSTSGYQDFV